MRSSSRLPARPGTASLELVLSLPLLLACAAVLLGLGQGGLGGMEATVTVRREAWQRRPHSRAPDPLALSSLRGSRDPVRHEVSRPLTGLPVVFPGRFTARARHTVPADAVWDWRDLPLDHPPRWGPHLSLLARVTRGSLPGVPDLAGEMGRFGEWARREDERRQAGLREHEEKKALARREIARLDEEIQALEQQRRATERIPGREERQREQARIDARLADRRQQRAKWRAGLEQLEQPQHELPGVKP
jgi:hypothetical protein